MNTFIVFYFWRFDNRKVWECRLGSLSSSLIYWRSCGSCLRSRASPYVCYLCRLCRELEMLALLRCSGKSQWMELARELPVGPFSSSCRVPSFFLFAPSFYSLGLLLQHLPGVHPTQSLPCNCLLPWTRTRWASGWEVSCWMVAAAYRSLQTEFHKSSCRGSSYGQVLSWHLRSLHWCCSLSLDQQRKV